MNTFSNRISIDPLICNGKPTFTGKRIAVETILEFLSAGEDVTEILRQYPSLEKEDIHAALWFATQLMQRKYTIMADA